MQEFPKDYIVIMNGIKAGKAKSWKMVKEASKTLQPLFSKELRYASLLVWLLQIIPSLGNLFIAQRIVAVVTFAAEGKVQQVLASGFAVLGIALALKIYQECMGIYSGNRSAEAKQGCRQKMYKRLLQQPLDKLYVLRQGAAVERLTSDFESVTQLHLTIRPALAASLLTAIGYFAYLSVQNLWIALILLGIASLQFFPPILVKKFMQENYEECREIEERITNQIVEGYRGFLLIRLYDLKNWWLNQMRKLHKQYIKIGGRSIYTFSAETMMETLLSQILQYGTYGILGVLVLYRAASMESGVLAVALCSSFYAAVQGIYSMIPQISVARAAEKRILQWDAEPSTENRQQGNEIEIQHVTYAVQGHTVLRNASAHINSAGITWIKGENGAGKSTLIRLLLGFLKADKGRIQILDDSIFYVPQEDLSFTLQAESLYQMLIPERAKEALQLAKQFGLTDERLMNQLLSELSGGERKKVWLVLALLKNAKILILDEPTTSLDEHGRQILKQELQKREGGTILITHESEMAAIADHVIRIEGGELYYEK